MDYDTLLRAQSERLNRIPAAPPMPRSRASAPAHDGVLVAVDGAAAVLETVTWPPEAFERVVLGDRTGYLHLAALPDPEAAGAQRAVTELVAAAAAQVAQHQDGLRAQLFLRWPSADTAMHPLLQQAGLSVDALWSARPAQPLPGRPAPGIRVRRAEPRDASRVGDLAVEELRYHLPSPPSPATCPWCGPGCPPRSANRTRPARCSSPSRSATIRGR